MTVILVLIFVSGAAVLFYPAVSSWWNAGVQSRAVAAYDDAVSEMSDEEYDSYFEKAYEYNERLRNLGSDAALAVPGAVEGYADTLDITGTGIMCYVTVESLGIELPVYHGTDESVLSAGAGHLEGSSLPVGGSGTHAVISAHRGLPSALMFTRLDRMKEGDIFRITVLDRTLTYRVDRISVVLPTELEELYITEGEDYCTLMTCTPYGINSHRLFVRGVRTEDPVPGPGDAAEDAGETGALIFVISIFLLLMILMLIPAALAGRRERNRRRGNKGGRTS